jgi:hypothetical protein
VDEGEPFVAPASSAAHFISMGAAPVRPQRARRRSSPESNSTTISQFDMVKDPPRFSGRGSPMSVIPEVRSGHTSPNPLANRDQNLRRQPSSLVSQLERYHVFCNNTHPRKQSGISLSHTTVTTPTQQNANTTLSGLDQQTRQNPMRNPSRISSNPSDNGRTLYFSQLGREDPRASSASAASVNITVQSPVRQVHPSST